MINTRSNPLAKTAKKTSGKKNGLTGRKLGYFLGNKLGMGNIKPAHSAIDKLIEPYKRY